MRQQYKPAYLSSGVSVWVVPQGMPGARKLFAAVPTGRPSLVQGGGRPAYPLKGSWRGVRHGGLGPYVCRSHEDSARSDGTILPVGHPPPARPPTQANSMSTATPIWSPGQTPAQGGVLIGWIHLGAAITAGCSVACFLKSEGPQTYFGPGPTRFWPPGQAPYPIPRPPGSDILQNFLLCDRGYVIRSALALP